MSCSQLALQRAGFEVDRYMASEIDKYGMQVTRKNFPNTIQMGDVCALRGENLPPIDLLMGGSPCQGFSFAGKQLNFKDPRSALFFEFVRLLKETNPKYFLLENVRMKKEYQDVISEHLGVKPVMICSSLVSAQSRKRLYWTNIPGLIQPEDKGIVLKDILEDLPIEKELAPYMTGEFDGVSRLDKGIFTFTDKDKGAAQTGSGGHANKYLIHRPCELKEKVLIVKEATKKGYTEIQDGDCFDMTFPTSKTRRGRNMKDKSNCLTAANYDYMRYEHPTYRKLTPMECERLQTVPDGYTEGVSNTRRYQLLGNGWTIDVIVHLLQGLKAEFIKQRIAA